MEDSVLKEVNVRLVLNESSAYYSDHSINSPEDAVDIMKDLLKSLDREMVCIVNVDNKNKPINYNIVSIGTLNSSVVQISNVFKTAILSNSAAILLFHNHPSGCISPSQEDLVLTKKIALAGDLLGVELLDHIIVGAIDGKILSLKKHHPSLFSGTMNEVENLVSEGNTEREKSR